MLSMVWGRQIDYLLTPLPQVTNDMTVLHAYNDEEAAAAVAVTKRFAGWKKNGERQRGKVCNDNYNTV